MQDIDFQFMNYFDFLNESKYENYNQSKFDLVLLCL